MSNESALDQHSGLSVFEYSQRVGVPERTVLNWCRSGRLPAVRDGRGHWRIHAPDLPTVLEVRSLAERVAALQAQIQERDSRLSDLQANLQTWRSAWDDERRHRQDLAGQSLAGRRRQEPRREEAINELRATGTDAAAPRRPPRAVEQDDLTVLAARLVGEVGDDRLPLPEDRTWRHGRGLDSEAAEGSKDGSESRVPANQVENVIWLPADEKPPRGEFEGKSIVEALRSWASSEAMQTGRAEPPALQEVIANDLEALESELPPSVVLKEEGHVPERRGLWPFRRRRGTSEPNLEADRLQRLRADLGLD
jgi:excisionase family DNA binding protein